MLRSLLIASIMLVGAATGMAQTVKPVVGQGTPHLSSVQGEGGIKTSFFCSFACSAGACGNSPMIFNRCLALCPPEAVLECKGGAKSAEAAVTAGGVEAAGSLARVGMLAPPGMLKPGSAPLVIIPSAAKANSVVAAKEDSEEGKASDDEEHGDDEEHSDKSNSGEEASEGDGESGEGENAENDEEGAGEEN